MSEKDLANHDVATVAESSPIKIFEDLECWEKCRELRVFVARELVPQLSKEERYRLGDQILRAARSTTANIACPVK
jgi:hypothetical protein